MTRTSQRLDTQGGSVLTWLRFAFVFILIAGVVYPIGTTLLGGALFPRQAAGSLIERDGVVVGSSLVGQPFVGDAYFIGRPSAADYDPFGVAGSNLAPTNVALRERVAATAAGVAEREGVAPSEVPVDLVAASGSGIDPHVTPEAAALQVPRVATARGLSEEEVARLVVVHTQGPTFGLLGMPRVHVLELNLALDALD